MSDGSRVLKRLTETIGIDPETVGEGRLAQAVARRRAELGLKDDAAYLRRLDERPEEFRELVELVVVQESWFFRDDRPFRLLAETFGGAARDFRSGPVRVLSIPCAGGEEPYSIAIALLESGLPAEKIRVLGVDLSDRAVERARLGRFGRNSFRGKPSAERRAFFHERDGQYELRPEVRALVEFRTGNLVDPALLADEAPFDAIFCRNVLIYMTPEARRRSMANLDRLLAEGGLLFVGHAEAGARSDARFRSHADAGAFAFVRGAPEPATAPAPPSPIRKAPKTTALARRANASVPAVPIETAATFLPHPAMPPARKPLLDEARALADEGRRDEAIALCEKALHEAGPRAEVFHLLGVLHQSGGDCERAFEALSRAAYLDADHDEALLALALLAERRGDRGAAAGYRRRADSARRRKEAR